MKKNKHFKRKITTLALATTTLLTSSGAMLAVQQPHVAFADTVTSTKYSTGVISPVNVPNGNFNSNSGSSLSAYNWTMQGETSTNKATSGAINTGSGFGDRLENYYLRKNPGTKSSDNNVLMINSKANGTTASHTAKRGYSSSSISLEANSFYSFQVSMKNDTNYDTHTEYVDRETPINYTELGFTDENPLYISGDVFNPKKDDEYTKPFSLEDDVYIKFDHPQKIKDTYLKKELKENSDVERLDNVDIFYDDDKFVGFIYEEQQLFTLKEYVQHTEATEDVEEKNDIVAPDGETIKTYTLENFKYNKDNKSYIVADESIVYTTTEVDDSSNNYSFGSFYLDGLKKDGKNYDVESNKQFERKSSPTWTTFYYFIATGDEKQSINLSLWLGTRDLGSTGVVFFDDCKGYRYSENEFWKAYQNNQDKTFNGKPAVNIIDLRSTTELVLPQTNEKDNYNFNFEQVDKTSTGLNKWEATGNARVFSTRAAEHFKNETGFDFVGSNLSCIVDFDGEKVDILDQNNYVLAVWANNNISKATSQEIDIHANEIYKVTAQYKISELSGNAYMFIKECENDLVPKNEKIYKLADEQASSAITSNPDNDYINDYGTVEFFVKGGARYDTKFNISLGVGKDGENATGCVLFDNIQITQATSEQYNAATNKVEFDAVTGVTRDFANGNFNAINVKENQLPSADNWTVQADTTNKQIVFNGVINTGASQFASYKTKYSQLKEKGVQDEENPYFFALNSANPKSPTSTGTEEEANNNIYMMGNYEASYQKLISSELNLEANKDYKISFQIKRTSNAKVKISMVSAENENFVLYKSENLQTQSWSPYEINIKSSDKGAFKVKLVIELGEKENFCTGSVYLDDFVLNSTDVTVDEHSKNLVDLTDYFKKLPTNKLTDNLEDSVFAPISGSKTSGNEVLGNAINITSSELQNDFKITKEDDTDDDFALLVTSQGEGSYLFQTNYNFDLSAEAYVVSFKLKTKINLIKEEEKVPENRGVSVWFDGYKKMAALQSADDYQEFKLYIKPSEAQSLKLNFAFDCDKNVSLGAAVIYNFKVESADDYDAVDEEIKNNKNYDVNSDHRFVTSTDEDTSDTETPDTDTDTENTSGNISDNAAWLLIPSLIMAAALIIAILGYFLRKIKIKKIQVKHAESYDRKDSLNVDVIKQKASEERDGEVKKQQQIIEKYQAELNKMEEEHKKKVIALRENDKGKVSKETDKEFKHFAQKRTAMAEKIESLNRQLEELKSPEHLLSLERKLYVQEENKRREIEKHSKKQNKEAAKKSKEKAKETKKNDKK